MTSPFPWRGIRSDGNKTLSSKHKRAPNRERDEKSYASKEECNRLPTTEAAAAGHDVVARSEVASDITRSSGCAMAKTVQRQRRNDWRCQSPKSKLRPQPVGQRRDSRRFCGNRHNPRPTARMRRPSGSRRAGAVTRCTHQVRHLEPPHHQLTSRRPGYVVHMPALIPAISTSTFQRCRRGPRTTPSRHGRLLEAQNHE